MQYYVTLSPWQYGAFRLREKQNNMIRKILLITAVLLGAAGAMRADDMAEYRAFADTVRADVYSMDLPAFKVREIPEKYRNESAVYKAIYENFDAKKKTGVGVRPGPLMLPTISRRARVEAGHLTRMLIHVNDKAALEKYSEFDFGTDNKKSYYEGYEKSRHAMGVRLIKPDGRIVDIDTSDFVEVEEGKKGEKKSRKLAIPGLEIGDDIDVFFYTETRMQNVNPDPVTFYLKEDAPILNYRIHCVIDDNLSTQYRTVNGAPDFTVTRDDDGNYVLDMEIADISSKEPRLWYRTSQQSPYVSMYVFNRRNSSDFTPKSARTDGLQANPSAAAIIGDRWEQDDWWLEKGSMAGDLVLKNYMKDGHKIAGEIEKMVKAGKISPAEGADYLYNLLCYTYIGNRARLDLHDFAVQFYGLLKAHKFPVEPGLSSIPDQDPLDEVINLGNTIYFVRLQGDSARYYFPPSVSIHAPSEILSTAQGRKAIMWRKPKERKKDPDGDNFFTIPMSDADDNRNITDVDVTVDGTALVIARKESHLGYTKRHAYNILSEEDMNEGYRKYLSRFGREVNVKEKKKEAADRVERYADGRRQQKDDFKEEIENYHGTAPAELIDGKVVSLGVDPAHPELVYELSYRMDDLVKRAGKNLVISVGKMLNDQLEVLPSDRDRDVDAYFGSPRRYITRITLNVPAGYSVNPKDLSALDRSVTNAAGTFSVKTIGPEEGKIVIEVTKCYDKALLPVAEWPDMLKVLDTASAWNSVSLLLEKK